jgi:WD40 repeat protein
VYDKEKEDAPFVSEDVVDEAMISIDDEDQSTMVITKSVNSANQKTNPVACWKISNHNLTDLAFSPDSRHLAVVGDDGYLRIIDYLQEKSVTQEAPSKRPVLMTPQINRHLLILLRRLHMCLLVARREVCAYRWSR